MNATCDICERAEGDEVDRGGAHDGVPLGPIERCETCGRLACPDCLHEADCCFIDAEEHRSDPDWAPPGWIRLDRVSLYGLIEFVRTRGA